jgi:hypothetical protein
MSLAYTGGAGSAHTMMFNDNFDWSMPTSDGNLDAILSNYDFPIPDSIISQYGAHGNGSFVEANGFYTG